VNGQRTHTNARTRKGPRKGTIAGKKKATVNLMAKAEKTAGAGSLQPARWQDQEVQEARAQKCAVWHCVRAATFNNTIVTITTSVGNTPELEEFRIAGFTAGSRKGTPFRGAAKQHRTQPAWLAITPARGRMWRVSGPGSGPRVGLFAPWLPPASRCAPSATVTPVPHNGLPPAEAAQSVKRSYVNSGQ